MYPKTKPQLPYLSSQYLGREVLLDELGDLTAQELRLLSTEAEGLHQDAAASVARQLASGGDYGMAEKLVRVSGRFIHAIEREEVARQRQQSFLELHNELKAVTFERDALRRQLDSILEGGK